MGDADEARKAKSLAAIEHHLRDLVKVFAALNENVLSIAKTMKDAEVYIETPPTVNPQSWPEPALLEKDKENGNDHTT